MRVQPLVLSHLTRGAWIEIWRHYCPSLHGTCRTSHEVRGLKWTETRTTRTDYMPSHLTRGAWIEITFEQSESVSSFKSHLTRGAWIEIKSKKKRFYYQRRRTSHEVRGLKYGKTPRTSHGGLCRTSHEVRGLKLINASMKIQRKDMSHLTRGAWIEIPKSVIVLGLVQVAPHTRCVD